VRAGLTQEVLAERAGLSLATLGALEQGRRQPRPHTVAALADTAPHVLLILEELARLVVATQPLTAVRLAAAAEARTSGTPHQAAADGGKAFLRRARTCERGV
jgi:transcriptional regulator with XRE-family HTH domain